MPSERRIPVVHSSPNVRGDNVEVDLASLNVPQHLNQQSLILLWKAEKHFEEILYQTLYNTGLRVVRRGLLCGFAGRLWTVHKPSGSKSILPRVESTPWPLVWLSFSCRPKAPAEEKRGWAEGLVFHRYPSRKIVPHDL